jgi:phage terminase Nu1 subunit (DNA packaging protein)
VPLKTPSIAKKTGLTRAGVKYKRDRGETDEEILSGKGRKSKDGETLIDAQLRKEKALADLRELEVAQKRGELIERKIAELAGANIAQMTRQRLQTVPAAVASVCAASTDENEVKRIIDAEITKQLEHLAEDFLTSADLSGGSASDSTTEEADGLPVG